MIPMFEIDKIKDEFKFAEFNRITFQRIRETEDIFDEHNNDLDISRDDLKNKDKVCFPYIKSKNYAEFMERAALMLMDKYKVNRIFITNKLNN